MVDGAGIPQTETLCRHGVAWYARTLGATLLARWAGRPSSLSGLLAEAIDEVAGRHRHTCDIADPSSPQATVAMVAVGDRGVHWLVLADVVVVLEMIGAPSRVQQTLELHHRRRDVLAAEPTSNPAERRHLLRRAATG